MKTTGKGKPAGGSLPLLKYTKMPALKGQGNPDIFPAGREGRCSRITGHTLIVGKGKIICVGCDATWMVVK